MHAGTLSKSAQAALAVLGTSGIFKSSYLAGGSALALHLGHRRSYDFDFYTQKNIRAEDIASQLGELGNFKTTLLEPPHTLLGEFQGVKLSIFRYNYPLIEKVSTFQNIALASLADISAMKLSAITGRATKRDYVDLYLLAIRFSLEQIFQWFDKKFGVLGNNMYVIIKALGFFVDAESDDMPQMLIKVSWRQVKDFFTSESLRLAKKYLE